MNWFTNINGPNSSAASNIQDPLRGFSNRGRRQFAAYYECCEVMVHIETIILSIVIWCQISFEEVS
jgi:hypothetical protein